MNRLVKSLEKNLLLIAPLLLFTACSSNKPANTQPGTTIQTEQQTAASSEAHAELAQQKLCADQAKLAFDASYQPVKDGMSYDFSSHFDSKTNICYILVHGGGLSLGSPASTEVVFDAFEGRTYASYFWVNATKKKYWEVAPMECSVKPRNSEEIICHTNEEFDSLIDKYFEVER